MIATATRCSCGHPVVLVELPSHARPFRYQAHCDNCLDPTEDAGRLAHVVGYGATPEEALWAWQDDHDDAHADQICWSVVPTVVEEVLAQAAEEFRRNRCMRLVERWSSAGPGPERGQEYVLPVLHYEPHERPAYPIAGGAR